jgi:hypothetical protein
VLKALKSGRMSPPPLLQLDLTPAALLLSNQPQHCSTWYGGWAAVRQHPALGHDPLETMTTKWYCVTPHTPWAKDGKVFLSNDEDSFYTQEFQSREELDIFIEKLRAVADEAWPNLVTITTSMSDLSPAAEAVLNAYMDNCGWLDGPMQRDYQCVAAVLRAAADQVVPPALEEEWRDRNQALPLTKMVEIRLKLLAIADELEAQ